MFREVWILKTKRYSAKKMLTREVFYRVHLYTTLTVEMISVYFKEH